MDLMSFFTNTIQTVLSNSRHPNNTYLNESGFLAPKTEVPMMQFFFCTIEICYKTLRLFVKMGLSYLK